MKKSDIVQNGDVPHIHPVGATFFVTCALKGAIPERVLHASRETYNELLSQANNHNSPEQKKQAKIGASRIFLTNIGNELHKNQGPNFLGEPDIARILLARIESYHMRYYKLLALSIMPNHFHMLIDTSVQIRGILEPGTIPKDYVQIDQVMKFIKDGSARYINHRHNMDGKQVWDDESFDLCIRSEQMLNEVVNYILENPVKAGLVDSHEKHPFTFLNDFV